MASKYSDTYCYNCYFYYKNNIPDNEMHKIEDCNITKGYDSTKYQMYVCYKCCNI